MDDSTPLLLIGHRRHRSWAKVTRGVYLPAGATTLTLADRLRAWSAVLPPTAAFTHLTAAELRGWWLPAAIPHPVFAAIPEWNHRARRPGLFVCRHPKPGPISIVDGMRVNTAAETLLAAARDLGALDLAIMADSALRLGHCTMTDLLVTARQRRRGAPLLRTVLPLLDPRSESAWETVMRILHRAAGLDVEPQHEIRDDGDRFVARADLWLRGTNRIHEYDGAIHRDAEVHARDLDRDARLIRAGWQRFGYTSRQILRDGPRIIAEANAAFDRPTTRAQLSAWNDLIDLSLFGRRGRARAYSQWRRCTAA